MKTVATLIRRVARGKHGSGNLSQTEARQLFSALLQKDADPLQLGAFLIAERMKGETTEEIAGFVEAARSHISGFGKSTAPENAVDLPCYAGKRRAAHAHLVAALQICDEGTPLFVHGVEHIEGRITAWQVLNQHGVRRARTLAEAGCIMQDDGIVYMDLSDISPGLHHIYQLRPRLGVRSFANTVARLLNPMQCAGQLNGFFHTPYGDTMAAANVMLGQMRSLIFMGAEGEPELYADRQKVVKMQVGRLISDIQFPDTGHEPYPRSAVEDLNRLFIDFDNTMNTDKYSREHATVRRMKEAFLWASGKACLKNIKIMEHSL